MKRTLVLLGLLTLLTTLLFSADASGKWKGSFDGGGTERTVTFNLKATGNDLTGTVEGLLDKPSEVKDGKMDGNTVSFWFMTEYQGNPIKLVCKGTLAGDEIKINMGLDDGQWSTDFVVKRGA
ncbi:MAG TPA: hypothetical protein VGH38_35390 [Bryobacteraceae bacterium]|jgi:hypothetical protein